MKAADLTPEDIADRLQTLGFPLFTADLDPTLVSIRAHEREDDDDWADVHALLWHQGKTLHGIIGQGTTGPGRRTLLTPGKKAGAGIVLPGHHKSCWSWGGPDDHGVTAHKYPCGRQVGPIAYVRDGDRDGIVDLGTTGWAQDAAEYASLYQAITLGKKVYTDIVFCDMHRASATRVVEEVGPYGAMCQVWQSPGDWAEVHAQMLRAVPLHGRRHSFTLLDEWGMPR